MFLNYFQNMLIESTLNYVYSTTTKRSEVGPAAGSVDLAQILGLKDSISNCKTAQQLDKRRYSTDEAPPNGWQDAEVVTTISHQHM